MPIIETEIWKPNPDRPGTVIFDSPRIAQDVFNELEAHLAAIGRMPDEYFSLWMDWKNGKPFPKDATLSCEVNFGGSEGIYLDISIAYQKDVYEHSRETGELGWHNRKVIERFATGKTLGESNDDLDRMNLTASSVTAAFYGYENGVHARYVAEKRNEPEKQLQLQETLQASDEKETPPPTATRQSITALLAKADAEAKAHNSLRAQDSTTKNHKEEID